MKLIVLATRLAMSYNMCSCIAQTIHHLTRNSFPLIKVKQIRSHYCSMTAHTHMYVKPFYMNIAAPII